eukprot:m.2043 g.2043  ORF g.2043 m.2043 type:complete len:230 (+) comp8201_c0_seq1:59-748(+)
MASEWETHVRCRWLDVLKNFVLSEELQAALMQVGLVSHADLQTVKTGGTDNEKKSKLVWEYMSTKGPGSLLKFCEALEMTSQGHLAKIFRDSLINGSSVSESSATGTGAAAKGASQPAPQPHKVLDQTFDETHVRKVYLKIKNFWRTVANALGGVVLTKSEIDSAERSHRQEEDQCHAMLHKWMIKQRGKGTVYQLCVALLDAGLDDVIEQVFDKETLTECRKRQTKNS